MQFGSGIPFFAVMSEAEALVLAVQQAANAAMEAAGNVGVAKHSGLTQSNHPVLQGVSAFSSEHNKLV